MRRCGCCTAIAVVDHDRASRYREVRVHQLAQRATRENLTTRPDQGPAPLTVLVRAAARALAAVWPEVECDELGQVLRANTAALQQATRPALWNQDSFGYGVLFRSATSLGETGWVTAARDRGWRPFRRSRFSSPAGKQNAQNKSFHSSAQHGHMYRRPCDLPESQHFGAERHMGAGYDDPTRRTNHRS